MRLVQGIALLMAIALLFCAMVGCGSRGGKEDLYEGFIVRTEKSVQAETQETETPVSRSTPDAEEKDYLLNTSSMRFHDPSCAGAAQISEHNRRNYHGSRESLLDMGYAPCKICNP